MKRPSKAWVITDASLPASEVARELLDDHPGWVRLWGEALARDGSQHGTALTFLDYLTGRAHAFRRHADAVKAAGTRPIVLVTAADLNAEFARRWKEGRQ